MGAVQTFLSTQAMAVVSVLLGGCLIALLIVRLGRGGFSLRVYGVALFTGALAALAAAILEGLSAKLLPALFTNPILFAFVTAGLVEEASKFAVAYAFVRPHYRRRTGRDLTLGVAAVALAFALVENVGYVLGAADNWQSIVTMRSMIAVPMHVLVGLILGRGLARYDDEIETKGFRPRMLSVLVIPILLHGLYDLPLLIGNHGPVPSPIQRAIEAALSIDAPTLLAFVSLGVVLAICLIALRIIFSLDRLARPRVAPGFAPRPIRPTWLNRLIFASWTGYVLGGLLSLATVIFFLFVAILYTPGLGPSVIPTSLAFALLPLTIGCALFIAGGRATAEGRQQSSADDQRDVSVRVTRRWKPGIAFLGLLGIGAGGFYMFSNTLMVPVALGAADASENAGDTDAAIGFYDVALRYRPNFVPFYILRAKAYRRAQRYAQALGDLDKALALDPGAPRILRSRARVRIAMHHYGAAAAELDRALAIAPNDPHLLAARAEVAFYQGDAELAEADFARAIELGPTLPEIHEQVASLFAASDPARAARELDTALTLDPNYTWARFTRGRLYYSSGDAKEAVNELYSANTGLHNAYTALWLYLARARVGQDGRSELAAAARHLSIEKWPAQLIELYLGKGSIAQARLSATNSGQVCEADFYVAEYLILHTSYDDAAAALKRAADRCPVDFIERDAAILELRRLNGDAADAAPGPATLSSAAGPEPPSSALAPPPRAQLPVTGLPTGLPAEATLSDGHGSYFAMASWRAVLPDGDERGAIESAIKIPKRNLGLTIVLQPRQGGSDYVFAIETHTLNGGPPWFSLDAEFGNPTLIGGTSPGPLPLAAPLKRNTQGFYEGSIAAADIQRVLRGFATATILLIPLGKVEGDEWALSLQLDEATRAAASRLSASWR